MKFETSTSSLPSYLSIFVYLVGACLPVTSLSPVAGGRAYMPGSLVAMSGQGGQRQNSLIVDLAF